MKILFIKDALKGTSLNWQKGQIKDVSDGYAMNYLIPGGFAQVVTPQIISKVEKEAEEAQKRHHKQIERENQLKANMEKREIVLKVKVGEQGQVFGGVHEKDVAEALSKEIGAAIDRSQVELPGPVKALGVHQIKLKLGNGISANVKIKLIARNA